MDFRVTRVKTGATVLGWLMLLWAADGVADDAPGWPRSLDAADGTVTFYQPQPESLEGGVLTARFAVGVALEGEADQVFGAVWIGARLSADRRARTVAVSEVSLERLAFNGLQPEVRARLETLLTDEISKWRPTLDLERLTATLELAQVADVRAEQLADTAPVIRYVDYPAFPIVIDGKPIMRTGPNETVVSLANTPSMVVALNRTGEYFVFDGSRWLTARDPLGKWTVPDFTPTEIVQITPNTEARMRLELGTVLGASSSAPQVLAATEPTEFLVTIGPAEYAAIEGTNLETVTNTESFLFRDADTLEHYVLLSGRWFRAASLDGPWTRVRPDQLPPDFGQIPTDSDAAPVRVHVAGTKEAREAVLGAHIPESARISLKRPYAVSYEGPPRFEPLEGTELHYGVNTSQSVVRVGDAHYSADGGVWYSSAGPMGPWSVADSLPAEIYEIPATSHLYNVTFLYVFDSDDTSVLVGYYPGYTGSYLYEGVMVFGTGWRYKPFVGVSVHVRPATWGFGFRYRLRSGWGYSFSYDPGYFFASIGFEDWDPCCWWGPSRWNADPGRYGPRGPFDYRGPLDPRRPGIPRGERPGVPRGVDGTPNIGRNNVFATGDGAVYRHGGGGWERRLGSAWAGVSSPPSHLDAHMAARSVGAGRVGMRGGGFRGGGRRR